MEKAPAPGASPTEKKHLIWPDLLKIFAIYAVILIHTAAPYLVLYEERGSQVWWTGNLYDSASRWCIPVFVMLSGFFLIEKYREDTFWSFFARRLSRVVIPFLIWSFAYFLWRVYANGEELSLSSFIPMLFMEPVYYHLWYMYLVIELYLLAPIMGIYMKYSCCRHNWYYLGLWSAVAVLLPFIEAWLDIKTYISIGTGNSILKFAGYFALGWMLKDAVLSSAKKLLFSILFLLGFASTALGTYYATLVRGLGQFDPIFYEYFSFSVFMMAVSIFLVAKSMKPPALFKSPTGRHRVLGFVAASVPGVYLVHAMIIAVAKRGMLGFTFTPEQMGLAAGIPVFGLGILAASLLIVLIIKSVPVLKYIVPMALIAPLLFASAVNAAEAEVKLIDEAAFKTLTGFAKTRLKKMPELEAWEKALPQVKTVTIESSNDKTSQKALFYNSGSRRKKPLLLVLHSWSEDYRQSFGIPYALFAAKNDWVFIQPNYRGAFGNPEATASEAAIRDILDALEFAKANAEVDPSRVYLAGFSGGGMCALIMAGRFPDKWAGVVSWGAVFDLVDWYEHTRKATVHDYAKEIAASCGGPPMPGTREEKECRKRSPSAYIDGARRAVPVYIAVGIDDTFVPPSHSLRAYNALADDDGRISDEDVESISKEHRLPDGFVLSDGDPLFEEAGVELLHERASAKAVLKIYRGRHDVLYNAGLSWLSAQKR